MPHSEGLKRFEEHLKFLVQSKDLYAFLIAGIRAQEAVLHTIDLGLMLGPEGDLAGWINEMRDVFDSVDERRNLDTDLALEELLKGEGEASC